MSRLDLVALQIGWIACLGASTWVQLRSRARLSVEERQILDEERAPVFSARMLIGVGCVAFLMALPEGSSRHGFAIFLGVATIVQSLFEFEERRRSRLPDSYRRSLVIAETLNLVGFALILWWVIAQPPIWGWVAA